MTPLTLEVAKSFFFDRENVLRKIDAAQKRVLSKVGAFVRQRARTSIRKRQGISPPGGPPYSHTDTLRRGILFGFDPNKMSVVIGPVLLGSQTGAPERLEYGGEGGKRKSGRVMIYRPRPFMGPALEAELPRARQEIKDCIT